MFCSFHILSQFEYFSVSKDYGCLGTGFPSVDFYLLKGKVASPIFGMLQMTMLLSDLFTPAISSDTCHCQLRPHPKRLGVCLETFETCSENECYRCNDVVLH